MSLAYNSTFTTNKEEIETLCLKFEFYMVGMMPFVSLCGKQ